MSRIASVFAKPNHVALIPYITVGYPSIETTLEVVHLFASSGCDIVELGIPFSDPLADGATIQKASFQALQSGVTPKLCLEIARDLSRRVKIPLIFMTYYNLVLNYGLEEFCSACVNSGIDGLIVPDLPPEEGLGLEIATRRHNLDLIYLIAPTSTEERIKLITERSRGFVYLVSVTGVTGVREKLPSDLEAIVTRVRKISRQPLCIGFGISTPDQARQVAKMADGVIVGSRIIELMESRNKPLERVTDFVRSLRNALDESAQ